MDTARMKQVAVQSKKAQQPRNYIDPTLEDIIHYLQERPQMIMTERNPYSADRLMMMLDNEKLAALEEEFNEHPNGIELPNFIWLMKCAISHPPDEKYELVNGLIKLFQDIDINGDGHMEWAEFTQYIIDAVIGEKDARFFDARFERDREMTELEVLDRAYSRKSKRYVPMATFDNSTHSNLIKKVLYAQNNDSVICLEQNSNKMKFYSSDCKEKSFKITPPSEDSSIFIIDFFIAEQLNLISAVTSDRQFFFWENNMTQRIVKSFKQDVLQTGIWYMPLHKLWITAGADYNIRGWDILLQDKEVPGKELFCLHAHMKQITEIVELNQPKLLASASLDGKIKLWDLADRTLITELKSPTSTHRGIRGLTYSYDYGSNLLSYGFETNINVWCPEVSITRAFIGKLEGHSSLIVMCKFIPSSPNCISVDDRTNIRIWDIRTMSSVQVVTGLCIITRSDRFVITGKRLNYYMNGANNSSKRETRGPLDDVYPIAVEFNLYYNCFVVLTKMDIRLYDAMSGKMKKVFNDLYDEKMAVDLSNFAFGGRQRKFFISDNAGLIRQYNMKNGEFLKKVNQHNEIENSEFANKLANVKKRDTLDISALLYLQEEKLLISASQDSTVRIYDESDPEESILLKVLCGGHQNAEILSMSYSFHFTLLATGSSNGLVAIWDFETGKMDGVLINQVAEVVAVDFGDPYPILVSGQSNGAVSLWSLKSGGQRYRCLLRVMNSGDDIFHPITAVSVLSEMTAGTVRYAPSTNLKMQSLLVDQGRKKQQQANLSEEVLGFQQDWDKYEIEIGQKKRRCFVYIADSRGMMHILNFTEFLMRKDIYEQERHKKGHSYQLKRKDLIDASKAVESFLLQEERSNNLQPLMVHLSGSVLLKSWQAHGNIILKMNRVRDPISFITNSLDKHLKIWSMTGECWADLNMSNFNETIWKFPFDWVGQKLKDIELVFDALKLIEKESLSEIEKERVKARFLVNKFFNDVQTEDLQRILYEQQLKSQGIQQSEPVQTKEKKRNIVNDKGNSMNFANKQVTEELRELKLKMKEDQENKKKIEVQSGSQAEIDQIKMESGLLNYERNWSQSNELVQRLLQKMSSNDEPKHTEQKQVQSTQKESREKIQENTQEQSQKQQRMRKVQSVQPQSRKLQAQQLPVIKATSNQKEQSIHQLKFSQQNLVRNNNYVKNMVNSLNRPSSEQIKYKFVNDIKYQKGESVRALKVATYTNSLKFMSQSPQIHCDDNQILQMKCKFYKEMNEEQKSSEGSELEDDEQQSQSKIKIIASQNFLNNPYKNKHKHLKTKKNKIFVV